MFLSTTLPYNRGYLTNYASYRNEKRNQIKVDFIFFPPMQTFMTMQAIETVGMAFREKSSLNFFLKSGFIGHFLWMVRGTKVKNTKQKLIQFSFEWCIVSWPSEWQKWSKWRSGKIAPAPKSCTSEPVMNCASSDVFWVDFIWKFISTILGTRMSIKPYVIRKRIEWALLWLFFFYFDSPNFLS